MGLSFDVSSDSAPLNAGLSLGLSFMAAAVRLILDERARCERDRRLKGGHGGAQQWR